jgi:putative transposase
MRFTAENLYHIYNRGINRQLIFFNTDNYHYFLKKIRRFIYPHCDILCWCLMPNHFHFLIHADERIEKILEHLPITKNVLSEGIRNLLSSYAKGINEQEKRVGNLFQQKTKAKCLTEEIGVPHYRDFQTINSNYSLACFHYIHQNPCKAGLVIKMEDWPYSSFIDYLAFRQDSLCNLPLALQLLDLNGNTFYADSYRSIPEPDLKVIFK